MPRRTLRGQGATEYLILFAIVLLVSLVSITLLSNSTSMVSDSMRKESEIYWSSSNPIAIVGFQAKAGGSNGEYTYPLITLRNMGASTINITKIISTTPDHEGAIAAYSSNGFMLQPGGEVTMGTYGAAPSATGFAWVGDPAAPGAPGCSFPSAFCSVKDVRSVCKTTGDGGYLIVENFGFEYVEYIYGNAIIKRQYGSKPLIIRCSGFVGTEPCPGGSGECSVPPRFFCGADFLCHTQTQVLQDDENNHECADSAGIGTHQNPMGCCKYSNDNAETFTYGPRGPDSGCTH